MALKYFSSCLAWIGLALNCGQIILPLHLLSILQDALRLVLLNKVSDTRLLSRLSCVSAATRQAAAEVARRDLKTLLPAAAVRHAWLRDTAPVVWLCKTAGPALVGSPEVSRAVVLELEHVSTEIANILAQHGEHVHSCRMQDPVGCHTPFACRMPGWLI